MAPGMVQGCCSCIVCRVVHAAGGPIVRSQIFAIMFIPFLRHQQHRTSSIWIKDRQRLIPIVVVKQSFLCQEIAALLHTPKLSRSRLHDDTYKNRGMQEHLRTRGIIHELYGRLLEGVATSARSSIMLAPSHHEPPGPSGTMSAVQPCRARSCITTPTTLRRTRSGSRDILMKCFKVRALARQCFSQDSRLANDDTVVFNGPKTTVCLRMLRRRRSSAVAHFPMSSD